MMSFIFIISNEPIEKPMSSFLGYPLDMSLNKEAYLIKYKFIIFFHISIWSHSCSMTVSFSLLIFPAGCVF